MEPHSQYDVLGRSAEELRAWMIAAGEPAYRGGQLYHALYKERRLDFAAMSNLPAPLRTRLAAECSIGMPRIEKRYQSTDGSVRYLLALQPQGKPQSGAAPPTARVEAVFMPSEGRQTICISTQAGCAVDCHFCLTAQLGLIRNLTAGEIVGQVLLALEDHRDSPAPRTNVVLMGQGEPLLNYEPVMAALRILLDSKGVGTRGTSRDAFNERDRARDRTAGKREDTAEAGDFAECIERRSSATPSCPSTGNIRWQFCSTPAASIRCGRGNN